jgi:microcystin-dependent protein
MANPFLGEIRTFGFNFAPRGWMLCQGQVLPIAQFSALFSLLGTTYGGNGQSTFALPDLRGRAPIHFGANGISILGESAGTETAVLLVNNLPNHTHFLNASTGAATAQNPSGAVFAAPDARLGPSIYESGSVGATMAATTLTLQGGNVPFSIMQPSLTVNFCISIDGIFPARN